MDLTESTTQSFIIKIWIEETVQEAGRATWRGHITHVPSNERRYVRDLDDVTAVIGTYLDAMGLELGWRWRLQRWLRRRWLDRSTPGS